MLKTTTFALYVALLPAAPAVASIDPPVAYYPFDTATGLADVSGNGHDGSAEEFVGSAYSGSTLGLPGVDTASKLGDGSLKLDEQGVLGQFTSSQDSNGQYVDITPVTSEFNTGDDSTISLWFRTDRGTGPSTRQSDGSTTGSSREWNDVLIGANNGGNAYRIGLDLRAEGIEGNLWIDSGFFGGEGYDDGGWHHLVVTNNGSTDQTTAWVDGVNLGTSSRAVDWDAITSLAIGMELDDAPGDFFDGWIDDLAFFDSEFGDEEVAFLYNGGAGRTVPEPASAFLLTLASAALLRRKRRRG
jgi:hypothetical protein